MQRAAWANLVVELAMPSHEQNERKTKIQMNCASVQFGVHYLCIEMRDRKRARARPVRSLSSKAMRWSCTHAK